MSETLRVKLAPAQRQPASAALVARPLLAPDGPSVVLGSGALDLQVAIPVSPTATTLFGPRGACLTPAGALWTCDTGHHRLLGWRHQPTSDNQPADWVIGQPDFLSEGRNAKGDVTARSLNVPTGITSCGKGLAVADAWNHRILIWHEMPESSHTPADIVLGQADFTGGEANRGSSAPTSASLFWSYGVHWDGERLWVADTGNRRVMMWNGLPSRSGQDADLVLGQADFELRDENGGGEPDASSMRWPHAITIWQGKLCVTDAGNNRILIWDRVPQRNNQNSDVVIGQLDAAHVDHNQGNYWPDAAGFNMPYGLAASDEWLLVTDTANSRLLGWHISECRTGAAAGLLTGQPDFEAKGDNRWHAPVRDSLCWPYGVMTCGDWAVVSDSGNNRVLLWRLGAEVLA